MADTTEDPAPVSGPVPTAPTPEQVAAAQAVLDADRRARDAEEQERMKPLNDFKSDPAVKDVFNRAEALLRQYGMDDANFAHFNAITAGFRGLGL